MPQRSVVLAPTVALVLALTAALALEAPAASAAQAPGPKPGCLLPGVDDRCEAWVTAVDHAGPEGFGYETPADSALSPDGSRLFVTSSTSPSSSPWGGRDILTVAFDTATGRVVWKAVYDGDENDDDHPAAIAVSPDGSTVFVGATVNDTMGDAGIWNADFGVVAYDAATGTQRWERTYNGFELQGRDYGNNQVADLVLSPDGATVYIAGPSLAGATRWDFGVFAYDAATGNERWRARYDRARGDDRASRLFAHGDRLYVVGRGDVGTDEPGRTDGNNDILIAAYGTEGDHRGAALWTAHHDVSNGDTPIDVVLTPDGGRLLVLRSGATGGGGNYAVTAYRTADGAAEWTTAELFDVPRKIVISPAGDRFFVTGTAVVRGAVPSVLVNKDYATSAFATADGKRLWTSTYAFPNADVEDALVVAVNPAGTRVYVSGTSSEAPYTYIPPITTVAYDAGSGAQKWVARHRRIDATLDADSPASIVVHPSGSRVFLAGMFVYRPDAAQRKVATTDLAALAYATCDEVCPLEEDAR